jgi:MFS-type transporter involved in bile tolerance (Atg22 family)
MSFAGQALGSIFCVWIMMKIGCVKTLLYFSIINIPFIVALILPALRSVNMESNSWLFSNIFVLPIIYITAFLNGLGQGVTQPASGNYISDCANEGNKSFYFALFWSCYMGSQVFGNLLAAFVLGFFP